MDPSLRILDASANRAREALRTLEDLARFALDRPDLCGPLKQARHDLTAALGMLPVNPALLTAARDTQGDVGTALTTASESHRADLPAVASAAGARAGEALRTIEELAKTLSTGASVPARIERVRYALYDAAAAVHLALSARAPQWPLCVLISGELCTHHPPERVAELALDAGATCIQVREKTLDSAPFLSRARAIAALCRARDAACIINDRPDIALLAGAHGVHLGQADLTPAEARRILGPGAIVGVSCSTVEHARAALAAHASYVGLGPMFPTTTKHKPVLAGPALIAAVLADPALAALPHLAIGGITPANAAELARVGCRGVAVSAAVCSATDPAAVCHALLAALGGAATPR
jgi:thiamine-phosphate pyrophosphorylase